MQQMLHRTLVALPALLTTAVALASIAAGQPAAEWRTGQTGRGTARWTRTDGGFRYQGGAAFGWAVLEGSPVRNGWVEVRFKPIDGREDRAGGVVWRWRDPDNYYIARANALEDNVVAYKMVGGRRSDLRPVGAPRGTYGVKVPIAADTWHTLRVDFTGADFSVTCDGRMLFTVRDETFADGGAVGLWSKADSTTLFERFRYQVNP